MNPKIFPIKTIVLIVVSVIWFGLSYLQWGRNYPDMSQLIFGICFGLAGLYLAYDQWYKSNKDRRYQEIVQMQDNFSNWKIKHEEEEGGEEDGDTKIQEGEPKTNDDPKGE